MGSCDQKNSGGLFNDASWYDRSINWSARLKRELPFLRHILGPPGDGGVLDAGCGPGRHAIELARLGYRVIGADADRAMLELAAQNAEQAGVAVEFVHASYHELTARTPGGFDGVICLANALAAAGDRARSREAISQFAAVLRSGGRLIAQVLNFAPMRDEHPCVRGPRVTTHEGIEHVSVRHFTFRETACSVTNITSWKDGSAWQCQARSGVLYPIGPAEIDEWCRADGLQVDGRYANYDGRPFDVRQAGDFIFTGVLNR